MQKFIIEGGKALYGSVRLGGAKNASSKIMIASLLSKGESRLLNFSHIDEIEITKEIVQSLGGTTRNAGERTLFIASDGLSGYQIPEKYGKLSRASTLFIPPLLARFQKAVVPFPGGDLIGKRPLDRHLQGLEKLGAKIHQYSDRIEASCEHGLEGCTYRFSKNTHTGTETLIMAAVLAKGKTIKEAKKITNKLIAEKLKGLPKLKYHCSLLGEQALLAAIKDYEKKKK